ncbi:DUF4032 domain-containing protein [Actinomyces timonensis]|uniref:DUF4032 domain-containing protein n=1 Tax=Actinomyces timonensis TaxID=1288391 RepID=UPI0002FFF8DD|nr:DUF4032 domain-containing protein [Actinomyces timonensis]
MLMSMQISAATIDPALLDLPWELPLEEWPQDVLAALPRGLSRHVVRFVNLSERVIAVKEIGESVAHREYELLRDLVRLGAPCVIPTAVITGRMGVDGEHLNSALVTEHLSYSLPYRALFSQYMSPDTATRLIDALAVLLVRLHLLGFYWGDVSLSNTLFRRDAGEFAAYLVDAETGELYPEGGLTEGKRLYDIDVARTNIIGELMDLQAGALLEPSVDTIEVGDRIVERYHDLWEILTGEESFAMGERWRVRSRIEQLNEQGFDVGELNMRTDETGEHLVIQPKVVDAGYYHRRLLRLTGLDVQERQGRRMLNDLEAYRATRGMRDRPIEQVAHSWLAEVFEPTIQSVPIELRRKLQPAEIFHEVLEHRWYMSEAQQRDVSTEEAVQDYIAHVLPQHWDEESYLSLGDTQEMAAIFVDDEEEAPIEDDAEFAARDEETAEAYSANPFGFTAGMKFKGE